MANRRKKDEKKISLGDKIRRIAWGRYLTIVFISAWMFILGILVGRGTAPLKFDIKKLSREIEELRAADMKKRVAPVEVVANEEKTKTTLGFYEELKKNEPVSVAAVKPRAVLNKSPVKQQKKNTSVNAKTAPVEKKESVPKSAPKAKKAPVVKSAAKKPEVKTVVPAAKSVKPVGEKTANAKEMTIQVASVKALEDADALVKKLNDKGYPAYKTIAIVPDKGIWFRIRVGQYKSREATVGMIGRLKKDGFRPMVVDRK
jgi:cell division septation protein DedD